MDIYYKLYCLDKREVTSSQSKDYMGRPGKGLTTFLDLSTKSSDKKKKARYAINKIDNQGSRNFIKKFKNSPYLGYKGKQVHNEPAES